MRMWEVGSNSCGLSVFLSFCLSVCCLCNLYLQSSSLSIWGHLPSSQKRYVHGCTYLPYLFLLAYLYCVALLGSCLLIYLTYLTYLLLLAYLFCVALPGSCLLTYLTYLTYLLLLAYLFCVALPGSWLAVLCIPFW